MSWIWYQVAANHSSAKQQAWYYAGVERLELSENIVYRPRRKPSVTGMVLGGLVLGTLTTAPFVLACMKLSMPWGFLPLLFLLFSGLPILAGEIVRRANVLDCAIGDLVRIHPVSKSVFLPRTGDHLELRDIGSIEVVKGWLLSDENEGPTFTSVSQVQILKTDGQRIVAFAYRGSFRRMCSYARMVSADLGVPLTQKRVPFRLRNDYRGKRVALLTPIIPSPDSDDSRNAPHPADN